MKYQHSAIIIPASGVEEGSIRTVPLPKSQDENWDGRGGVTMLIGRPKGSDTTTSIAYHFPTDIYNVNDVKAWLKHYNVEYKSIEPGETKAESTMELYYASQITNLSAIEGNGVRFEKDLIPVGTFLHPDDPKIKVIVTRIILEEFVSNFNKYKEVGGKVYIPLKHTNDPEKNTGWLEDMFIKGDAGQERLIGIFNITEPDIAQKIENGSIGMVSISWMKDYQDEKGNKYKDFINHVALTNTPQIRSQGAFIRLEQPIEYQEVVVETNKVNSQADAPGDDKNNKNLKMEGNVDELQKAKDEIKRLTDELKVANDKIASLELEAKKGNPDKTKLEEATKEIENLKKVNLEARNDKIKASVENLISTGKLPPANREKVIALCQVKADAIELSEKDSNGAETKRTMDMSALVLETFEAMPVDAKFVESTKTKSEKPGSETELSEKEEKAIDGAVESEMGGKLPAKK